MSTVWQDLRHGLRLLARNPGFTAVAVLTLAIALGANTAVFSVMNGVLLRALPYPEPDRIVDVSVLLPPSEGQPGRKASFDSQRLAAWRESARTIEHLAAYRTRPFTLSGQRDPERLTGASVSVSLFPLLGVAPVQGRTFRSEERQPGSDRVVLLSHGLWQRRFQGDPGIVGQAVTLGGAPYTVVGVMPAGFFFPAPEVELWTPLAVEAQAAPAGVMVGVQYDPAIARLRDGVTVQQAEAEAQAVLRSMGVGGPADELLPGRVRLVPLRDEMVAEVRPALLAMFAAVGLVLLIACANLSSLLLARSSARQREIAIRSAVGGGRARLVRQMLTESLVLSLAGGMAGMLLAFWVHRLLPRLLPRDIPRIEEVELDARVFLFAFLLSAAAGLLAGLLPALRSSGANLVGSLYGEGAETPTRRPLQGLFVVAEIALAFVLLVGAGLLLRSFLHLVGVELGYEPDRVLTATLDLGPAGPGASNQGAALFDELLSRLGEHAEVEAAGVVSFPPLTPSFAMTGLDVVGQPPARTMAVPQMTSPGYLQAMGLRLVEGRWLTAQDHATQAPVAVVNRAFVQRHIQGPEALGRRLAVGSASLEIVGVLEDVRLLGLDSEPKPELFTSYGHAAAISGAGPARLTLVIRTREDPSAVLPFVRALVLDLDPELALEDVRMMKARISSSVAQPRFYALLLGLFAAMALVLAAAGVYGVLSYAVARQTRAIGVRRALGAGRRDILGLILGRGVLLVSAGLLIGMAVAVVATRVLAHLLYSVTTKDPLSYVVAALSLAGIAALACWLPARRATRVEPIEALRYDR